MHLFRILSTLLITSCVATAQQTAKPVFKVIPLGTKGGIDESNLSAYLVALDGGTDYISLDAGTLHYGLQLAVNAKLFRDSANIVLKNNVKAYLVSHPHLDHISGLIINAPDDGAKTIYALPHTIDILRDKYFTWQNWANFADEGELPTLKKYHYHRLNPGIETMIDSTPFAVKALPLSHGNPYQSTAFLVRNENNFLLYLGDTGADTIEKANNLRQLWTEIAPLVKTKKLRAIFIEVSYPDEQPLAQLFGHLTPSLLMREMQSLASLTGSEEIKGLPVVITHMKPSGQHEQMIKKELETLNRMHLRLVFPVQARLMKF